MTAAGLPFHGLFQINKPSCLNKFTLPSSETCKNLISRSILENHPLDDIYLLDKQYPSLWDTPDEDDRTPIWFALACGHYAAVLFLLKKRCYLETYDKTHRLNLFGLAILFKNVRVLHALFEHCLEVDFDYNKALAFDIAENFATVDLCTTSDSMHGIVKAITSRAVMSKTFSTKNGRTLLHKAVIHGCPKVLKVLLDAGVDPNARDITSYTPLHIATILERWDLIEILVSFKANPYLTLGPEAHSSHIGKTAKMLVNTEWLPKSKL